MHSMKYLLFLVIIVTVLASARANAIVLTAPKTGKIGEPVTIGISGNMPGGSQGYFTIDSGDSSKTAVSREFATGADLTNFSYSTSHQYSSPGTYIIVGIGVTVAGTGFNVDPPVTVRSTINIYDAIVEPPNGAVGTEYEYILRPRSGDTSYQYRVTRGTLPPGLTMDRYGRFTGIPTKKGKFPITLQIFTSNRLNFTQDLMFYVDPGPLVIDVTPDPISITSGSSSTSQVTLTVVQPTVAINETIVSNRGEFYLANRLVGTFNRPMSINLNQPSPSATETVTIPPSVLQAIQASGNSRVKYRRSFRPINLNPGYAESRVNIRTPASGELRITKLRIYFEQNDRPTILVERDERDLTGAIDIHFNGSGTFKGYWKVDERIIQRVQKNIFYGKVLTLNTPETPPLPTYSEGAHRLQFIITEPQSAEKIDFPEAIYHVEAKTAVLVTPITLTIPKNHDDFDGVSESFSWSEVRGTQNYTIDFFEGDQEQPFFSAFTKTGSYALHERLLHLKFTEGTLYEWQVKSFNTAGELNGRSDRQSFSMSMKKDYLPRQVVFLISNGNEGAVLLREVVSRYKLTIINQVELKSLNQILVTCSTQDDIESLLEELQKEKGLYNIQPNYIFSTLQEADPLRSMQSIDKLIDLDMIHQKYTGKNVLIAIIDTGVDINHRDLQNSIREHKNFITGTVYKSEVHGTGVAGIIAGARNEFGMLGIAPDAKLLALRACSQTTDSDPAGECASSSIAKAIDSAIQAQADIANLSLGTQVVDPLISRLISAGNRKGLHFIAPVGNDPKARKFTFPASHPDVTAVAGFDESGQPLPNKALATAADAVAPARSIFSTIPENRHNFLDGTSFSTAAISGIMALSMEAHGINDIIKLPRFTSVEQWMKEVNSLLAIQEKKL